MEKNRIIAVIEEVFEQNGYSNISNEYSHIQNTKDNYRSIYYQEQFGFLIYTIFNLGNKKEFAAYFFASILKESNLSKEEFKEKITSLNEVEILGQNDKHVDIKINLDKALKSTQGGFEVFTNQLTENYKFDPLRTKKILLEYIEKFIC